MISKFDRILGASFTTNSPATSSAIAKMEASLGESLPTEYRSFLRAANGGEGSVGRNYLVLWSTEDMARLNAAYEVKAYADGLVLFGSDGGGEGYAFDLQSRRSPVVVVPFVGLSRKESSYVAASFLSFLKKLRDIDGPILEREPS